MIPFDSRSIRNVNTITFIGLFSPRSNEKVSEATANPLQRLDKPIVPPRFCTNSHSDYGILFFFFFVFFVSIISAYLGTNKEFPINPALAAAPELLSRSDT